MNLKFWKNNKLERVSADIKDLYDSNHHIKLSYNKLADRVKKLEDLNSFSAESVPFLDEPFIRDGDGWHLSLSTLAKLLRSLDSRVAKLENYRASFSANHGRDGILFNRRFTEIEKKLDGLRMDIDSLKAEKK